MIDAALLREADELATKRGQTRRVFVERALQSAVHNPEPPAVVKQYDENAKGRT
jgi:predicted transcriptional regulator